MPTPDAQAATLTPPAAYTGPERRHEYRLWREKVDKRLDEGAATMRGLRVAIDENTATTHAVQGNTQEAVDLLNSFKGAFRVLELVGKAAKPMGYIATACIAFAGLFSAWSHGGPGK